MPSPIFESPEELSQATALTVFKTPEHRKAYSDRTAWQMACYSELAYIRFNPPVISGKKRALVEKYIEPAIDESKRHGFEAILDSMAYDHVAEEAHLQRQVQSLGAKLEKTFAIDGTEAILVSTDSFIVLAFRGTESTSIRDIKTDARANTRNCPKGGKVHSGFDSAFYLLQTKLKQPSRYLNIGINHCTSLGTALVVH